MPLIRYHVPSEDALTLPSERLRPRPDLWIQGRIELLETEFLGRVMKCKACRLPVVELGCTSWKGLAARLLRYTMPNAKRLAELHGATPSFSQPHSATSFDDGARWRLTSTWFETVETEVETRTRRGAYITGITCTCLGRSGEAELKRSARFPESQGLTLTEGTATTRFLQSNATRAVRMYKCLTICGNGVAAGPKFG
jgi:hypothetical protein